VKKYNTPKPNRRPKVKSKSQIQFGEMGRYLKTTRMNRVNFDFPKPLNFRSKSAEKIESPEKLSYDFIGKGNRNFLKNFKQTIQDYNLMKEQAFLEKENVK